MVLCCMMAVSSLFCISASAATVTSTEVDNDTGISGCSNSDPTGVFWLYYDSGCKYGEARITNATNYSGQYKWNFPSIGFGGESNSATYRLTTRTYVYLNSSTFTDTGARYKIRISGYETSVGSLNQNTAPSGWSVITYNTMSPNANGAFWCNSISVLPSGHSNQVTGADSVYESITYTKIS